MKGKYKTPNGEIKEVHSFDAENKIVSVHKGSGQYEFHGENEYKDWQSVDEDNVNTQGLEPEVFETEEENSYEDENNTEDGNGEKEEKGKSKKASKKQTKKK